MPSFEYATVGTSAAEEVAGAEGVVASNHPAVFREADGHGEIVIAFSIVGAGTIVTALGVIDFGPKAVG